MSEAVSITGFEELNTKFSKLSPALKKEIKSVNKAAAEVVSTEAKSIVPVRDGLLQKSIRPGATLKAGVVRAGKASVQYAGGIHFGVGPRAGRKGPHNIAPRPFLYEALDLRRAEVIARYEEGVTKVINEVGA